MRLPTKWSLEPKLNNESGTEELGSSVLETALKDKINKQRTRPSACGIGAREAVAQRRVHARNENGRKTRGHRSNHLNALAVDSAISKRSR